ncbi:hypothetical protein [Actinomadura harenae]|uniref:Uncharacterized protein n=1 Tax=Actinomadura harenae TaxID=2483351 RepID=A0A3M2LCS3_9ACTN|nr:hypothetical protein [Actinomadura harenae]RMI33775.1 hypothetical protein EBO15_41385 [Actinomadura harenae]
MPRFAPRPPTDLPCGDCGQPRLLDLESGEVCCENSGCPAAGLGVWLWKLIDRQVRAGGPDRCPAGWPRPAWKGCRCRGSRR